MISDGATRANLEQRFSNGTDRRAARARFMREVIGMNVPEPLRPLADTCGSSPRWLLDPAQVLPP